MPSSWIRLPAHWKLQDVQAALNVVVASISTLAVFSFVRYCWQRAAKPVAKPSIVSVPSLLTINTIGEVLDVAMLLKQKLFKLQYAYLFIQCLIILLFSTTTIFSGPIVRYSTKTIPVSIVREVNGSLANRLSNGREFANVPWNVTDSRLRSASFPEDQLLDFLPDNTVDWLYQPEEWNSSWTMKCEQTPLTYFKTQATGNCDWIYMELPGLVNNVFSLDEWNNTLHNNVNSIYNSSTNFQDVAILYFGVKSWDYNETEATNRTVRILLSWIHLRNAPVPAKGFKYYPEDCTFGIGDVGEASFTKAECEIQRQSELLDYRNVAFPDNEAEQNVANGLSYYFVNQLQQESYSHLPITVVTPEQLIRFYQSYMIVQDTSVVHPVTRRLSVRTEVVHLSAVFLSTAVFISVLNLLGLIFYGVFAFRYRSTMSITPQSKLDWIIQSTIQASLPSTGKEQAPSEEQRLKHVVSRDDSCQEEADSQLYRRTCFELAKFGREKVCVEDNKVPSIVVECSASTDPSHSNSDTPCECSLCQETLRSKSMISIRTLDPKDRRKSWPA